MSATIKVARLNLADIENKAAIFSSKYNPEDILPFPIDHIIDEKIGIHIIPVMGLAQNNIEGFLSSDMHSISIDLDTFNSDEFRFRYILAHEIGHYALHSNLYGSSKFNSQVDYKAFTNNIGSKQYGRIEYQAQEFAKYVLVPSEELKNEFDAAVSMIKTEGALDLTEERNKVLSLEFISRVLRDPFNVSEYVIAKCIERDNLII